MRPDRFRTASRLAEAAQVEAPKDPRGLMRPRTASQVREEEFRTVVARREFGRNVAEDAIVLAMSRILYPADYGRPVPLDSAILSAMDDADIRQYAGGENADRLIRFRDAIVAREEAASDV